MCCKLAEDQYFDSERKILEHFKFKKVFLKRTKKAFRSFVPKELIRNVSENKLFESKCHSEKVQRTIGKLRFGNVQVHGALLTKYLNEVEINFLGWSYELKRVYAQLL